MARELTSFEWELKQLINKFSKENTSNTPDNILARFLADSLAVFNLAVDARESYYGRDTAAQTATRIRCIERLGGYTDADIAGGIRYEGEFVLREPTLEAKVTPSGIDEGDEHVAN